MSLLAKFTYRHQSLEVFQLSVFGTLVVVKAMLLVNHSEDSVSVIWNRVIAHLPYCSGWTEKGIRSQLLSEHLCLFLELGRGARWALHLVFACTCLSIKWNRRARGCVCGIWNPQERKIILDARTQNRKCIQMLHFRKDTNILIYVLLLFSILSFLIHLYTNRRGNFVHNNLSSEWYFCSGQKIFLASYDLVWWIYSEIKMSYWMKPEEDTMCSNLSSHQWYKYWN